MAVRDEAEQIQAGTFHSDLRRCAAQPCAARQSQARFSIYDEDDAEKAIKRLLIEAEEAQISPGGVLKEISANKNHAVPLPRYESLAIDQASLIVARVWREYELELKRGDALDFDDLLLGTVQLLKGHPDLRAAYQHRWPSILVDEYQDTNPTQARLLALLAGRADAQRNLMVVGDDKQVIYGFRLADVRLILGFQEEYPGATVLMLKRNYRNSPQVLAAANALIAHNASNGRWRSRRTRKPRTARRSWCTRSSTDAEEARWIAFQIQRAIEQGIPERNIAVLARWGTIVDRVEHALAAAGISYQVIGSRGFFKRKEIRTALAHLRLLVNPRDEAAFAQGARDAAQGRDGHDREDHRLRRAQPSHAAGGRERDRRDRSGSAASRRARTSGASPTTCSRSPGKSPRRPVSSLATR